MDRTNIRYPLGTTPPDPPSRGNLLKDFLAPPPADASTKTIDDYLRQHESSADQYEGFNLLLFDLHDPKGQKVGYLTNRPKATRLDLSPDPQSPGPSSGGTVETHGLSNTPLHDPFAKVTEGQSRMGRALKSWSDNHETESHLVDRMMDLLS